MVEKLKTKRVPIREKLCPRRCHPGGCAAFGSKCKNCGEVAWVSCQAAECAGEDLVVTPKPEWEAVDLHRNSEQTARDFKGKVHGRGPGRVA